jgi:hypothetical protein
VYFSLTVRDIVLLFTVTYYDPRNQFSDSQKMSTTNHSTIHYMETAFGQKMSCDKMWTLCLGGGGGRSAMFVRPVSPFFSVSSLTST